MNKTKRARLGGYARAAKLTAEQRSKSARRAVTVRWAKKRSLPTTTITIFSGTTHVFWFDCRRTMKGSKQ